MHSSDSEPDERSNLLQASHQRPSYLSSRRSFYQSEQDAHSLMESFFTKEEQALSESAVGERLPYNDYTTVDFMHDLVKDSYRSRQVRSGKGLRAKLFAKLDSASGWFAVAICGTLTAMVAFSVDIAVSTVSDWKYGYCKRNPFLSLEFCCEGSTQLIGLDGLIPGCDNFYRWSHNYWKVWGIYSAFALLFGTIAGIVTVFSKRTLPAAAPGQGDGFGTKDDPKAPRGKVMYMSAGSGIPEIKTVLSGFVIPHLLTFKVLVLKAIGATFVVPTGMCLGKEGPYVHISACVGNVVCSRFPRYRDNGRKMREILGAAVAAGISTAFGAPIGGVLFAYEEVSTYFPRKILWRAFLCSAFAAIVLKELNPTGTGKLVLFETHFATVYRPIHYLIFVLLGVGGGIWGGVFCKLNFRWSKWFRSHPLIKHHPVLEVFLATLVTVILQYPNPLTREAGDVSLRNLFVDCREPHTISSWVCRNELRPSGSWDYVGWLAYGTLIKLVLTIVTFGIKVPSGIIIPALHAGGLFGRLVGQWVPDISPGIFAMVSAGAYLAGASRMTISLCVILFELTGELEYIVPHMVAILVAKWTADSISHDGVYDLAQSVIGHPFLDTDRSTYLVQRRPTPHRVKKLIPPRKTMEEVIVSVGRDNKVPRFVLQQKLNRLKDRGLMDGGLALVQDGYLQGWIPQNELEFGLEELGALYPRDTRVRLLGHHIDDGADEGFVPGPAYVANGGLRPTRSGTSSTSTRSLSGEPASASDANGTISPRGSVTSDEEAASPMKQHPLISPMTGDLDLSSFVDRTPISLCATAPMEYAVEAFGKLGLRHLMVTEEGTGKLIGVILKKRLLAYLESLH